ncbi:MAG: hypothetical protein K2X81_03930 [Candidatus Obscuribacterales bacterium]|nr:hypothetical protein [Candidatus Obscuribacterales bacterium]
MPETSVFDKNRSIFPQPDYPLSGHSDAVNSFWKDTFIAKPGNSADRSPSKTVVPRDEYRDTILPHVDLHERLLLEDLAKTQAAGPISSYTPMGYSPSERLAYLNKLSGNMLSSLGDIDLNEDDAISKRELEAECYARVMIGNPKSSQYLINNFDRLAACSNGSPALFTEKVPELNRAAISRRDLTALKALSGSDAELLSYATDANWAAYGGLAVNAGFIYTTVLGLSGFSVSKKMGVLGVGVGLAATALTWQLALNHECNLLKNRRNEFSMDVSLDEAIRAMHKSNYELRQTR